MYKIYIRKSSGILVTLFLLTFIMFAVKLETLATIFFIFNIFICIGLGWDRPELLAICLIVIETYLFGALPAKVFGILPTKFEYLVFIFSYIYWGLKKFRNLNVFPKTYKLLLFTIVIILEAAIMGFITVGQSIFLGVFLQNKFLILLSVFPITALMFDKRKSFDDLKNWIVILGIVQSLINILQLVLYPRVQFLTITSENLRFGSIRITYGYNLIAIAFILVFSYFLNDIKLKNGLVCLIYAIDILFVCKTRMVAFGILIATIIMISKGLKFKSNWRNLLLLMVLASIALVPMFNQISELVNLSKQEITTNSGNYVARTDEIDFYTKQVKHPLVGRGFISPNVENGKSYDTKYGYFSLSDIGVISLYVTNGIIGIIWFVMILYILIRTTKGIIDNGYYVGYIAYSIAVCLTLLNFYFASEYLLITLVLLAGENTKNKIILKGELMV